MWHLWEWLRLPLIFTSEWRLETAGLQELSQLKVYIGSFLLGTAKYLALKAGWIAPVPPSQDTGPLAAWTEPTPHKLQQEFSVTTP